MEESRPSIESLLADAKNKKYNYLYEFVIQLILILNGVRRAYLLETSNIFQERRTESKSVVNESIEQLLNIIRLYKLQVLSIPSVPTYPRYLISRDIIKLDKSVSIDVWLGRMLGFSCSFCDTGKHDTVTHTVQTKGIFSVDIITEICKSDAHDEIRNAASHWTQFVELSNLVLNKYGITLAYTTEYNSSIDTRIRRIAIKDFAYVRLNVHEYANDLMNCLNPGEDDSQITGLVRQWLKQYNVFRLLYLRLLPFNLEDDGLSVQSMEKLYHDIEQWY